MKNESHKPGWNLSSMDEANHLSAVIDEKKYAWPLSLACGARGFGGAAPSGRDPTRSTHSGKSGAEGARPHQHTKPPSTTRSTPVQKDAA
jgi:hypothetical protein